MEAEKFYKDVLHLKNDLLVQQLGKMTIHRTLGKGEIIVNAGCLEKEVYFLESGIVRGVLLDANGNEITDCFIFKEGQVALANSKVDAEAPSPLTIEVLVESSFFCLPVREVCKLIEKYQEITLIYNRLLLESSDQQWKIKQVLNQCTAMQRYQWFLEAYPGLIEKVNHKDIASFLGMTPVTLSRLRKVIRENQSRTGLLNEEI